MNNYFEKQKNLKEAIVSTIAFFDIFDYPLTTKEVWQYTQYKTDYLELHKELEALRDLKIIEKSEGLYFFSNKISTVEIRKKRYNYSERKNKIALSFVKKISFIPWVKMVFLANSIGSDNLRDQSDIDLFIVTERRKVWLTRFFMTTIAKFLNLRPKKDNTQDKICLSFYVSEDAMNLDSLRISDDDIYFHYWFISLQQVFVRGSVYEKFIVENNKIFQKFPNIIPQNISSKRDVSRDLGDFYKKNFELIFGRIENILKNIQIRIMPKELKKLSKEKIGVILEQNIIKLHLRDKREYFINRHNEKKSKIKI